MVKIEFVKAEFKKIYKQKKIEIPTGVKQKSFFGLLETEVKKTEFVEECVGVSDSEIDGEQLAKDINDKVNILKSEGYNILEIIPITSGKYDYQYSASPIQSRARVFNDTEKVYGGGSYGYGYGYSYTEGVLIYAEKKIKYD